MLDFKAYLETEIQKRFEEGTLSRVPSFKKGEYGPGKLEAPSEIKEFTDKISWKDFFTETSQRDNLADYIDGRQDFKEFIKGFFPRSKNKSIILSIPENKREIFKQFCKKIYKKNL